MTGRAILEVLIDGERDPVMLAGLAKGRLKVKSGLLARCVPGGFNDFHATMVRELLDHIDYLDLAVARLDDDVDLLMVPFVDARDRLDTIPGHRQTLRRDRDRGDRCRHGPVPDTGALTSWAGLCPGNNESAGTHRATTTRSGNPWLTSALVEAAWAAVRTKDCYLAVRFRRIRKRRGEQRALIAVAHTILVICRNLLAENTVYDELGTDYIAGRDQPE